jgi:hypothetical protein
LRPGIASAATYIVKTYREPPADCVRQTCPLVSAAWPVIRGRCIARPGRCLVAAGRGPWCVPGGRPRATWCAPWCAWCLVRGPRSWPPGGRSVAPGACALVAAGRGACAWWRAPWCLAAGARSGSPGPRRAAPGWGGRAQKTGRVVAGEGLGPVLRSQSCAK